METNTKILNKEFESASPEKKRVMIAQDVIRFLDQERILAYPGTYFNVPELSFGAMRKINKEIELCEVLREVKECELCAIGGMFYSAVMNHNNLKVSDVYSIERLYLGISDGIFISGLKLVDYLEKFFSRKMLRLIETAFEGDVVEDVFSDSDVPEVLAAIAFYNRYDDPKEIMIAIMENIINNNGEFKP